MDSSPDQLHKAITDLFPDQFEVHKVIVPVNEIASPSLLHQHFHEPLLADKKEQLVIEIARYLSDCEKHSVYSYFYRTNPTAYGQSKWHMATARLNKNKEDLFKEVVIFSYDLELFGGNREKLYRVLSDDGFFKMNFNKISLLTKREKEIVGLLASGNNSAEIANKLFVSVHTVYTHRKSINRKLDIKNIADVLRIADVFELNITQPV